MAAPMETGDDAVVTKGVTWIRAYERGGDDGDGDDGGNRTGFVRLDDAADASFVIDDRNRHATLTTTVPIDATFEDEIDAAMAAAGFRVGDAALRAHFCAGLQQAETAVFKQLRDDYRAGTSTRSPDGLADDALIAALHECVGDEFERDITLGALGAAMHACVGAAPLRVVLSAASIDATIDRASDNAGSSWTITHRRHSTAPRAEHVLHVRRRPERLAAFAASAAMKVRRESLAAAGSRAAPLALEAVQLALRSARATRSRAPSARETPAAAADDSGTSSRRLTAVGGLTSIPEEPASAAPAAAARPSEAPSTASSSGQYEQSERVIATSQPFEAVRVLIQDAHGRSYWAVAGVAQRWVVVTTVLRKLVAEPSLETLQVRGAKGRGIKEVARIATRDRASTGVVRLVLSTPTERTRTATSGRASEQVAPRLLQSDLECLVLHLLVLREKVRRCRAHGQQSTHGALECSPSSSTTSHELRNASDPPRPTKRARAARTPKVGKTKSGLRGHRGAAATTFSHATTDSRIPPSARATPPRSPPHRTRPRRSHAPKSALGILLWGSSKEPPVIFFIKKRIGSSRHGAESNM
jgi:hypothetical protein